MKFYTIVLTFIALACIATLTGCYGNSPGLDPTITFTMPTIKDGQTIYVPEVQANAYLVTKGTIGNTSTDNVVTKQQWAQQTDVAGAPLGTFFTTDQLETSWQAPDWKGPGTLPITLTLTVETSMGGQANRSFTVLVVP